MPKKKERNQVNGSYAEYFATTTSPKLKKKVNIKELLNEEIRERHRDLVRKVLLVQNSRILSEKLRCLFPRRVIYR